MPRNITTEFAAWLKGDQLDMAICMLLTTPSGIQMGFTTWDEDLIFQGVTYYAQNAVTGSAIDSNIGTGVDNMEVTGILISDGITDSDVAAHIYDRSRLKIFILNATNLTIGNMTPLSGVLGDFKTQDGKYIVELRSLTQLLSMQIGESVGPTCSVQKFCDSRCKLNAATGMDTSGNAITSVGTVTSIQNPLTLSLSGIVSTIGYYTYGTVKFLTGANAGFEREIKVHGNPSSLITKNIASSPTGFGSIGFDTNTADDWVADGGTNFSFTIPQGSWSAGYITSTELWNLITMAQQGTDGLYISLPTDDQYLIANESWTGEYQHSTALSITTLNAINAISTTGSGTLNGKMQHWNSQGIQIMDIAVSQLVLTLLGTPSGTSDLILLGLPFPYPIEIGDTANVIAGCDRLITTCNDKWNNVVNFRGFPYLPGIDMILSVGTA